MNIFKIVFTVAFLCITICVSALVIEIIPFKFIALNLQEIYGKLEESSLPKGFFTDEHPSKDVSITELLNSIKEEHLKDFEQEYHLAEKIAQVCIILSVEFFSAYF